MSEITIDDDQTTFIFYSMKMIRRPNCSKSVCFLSWAVFLNIWILFFPQRQLSGKIIHICRQIVTASVTWDESRKLSGQINATTIRNHQFDECSITCDIKSSKVTSSCFTLPDYLRAVVRCSTSFGIFAVPKWSYRTQPMQPSSSLHFL